MNNLLIKALKDLILQAGEIALLKQKIGLIVERKNDNSLVSNADKEISEFIYPRLQALTPEITIICEEQPLPALTSDTFWLIDPIDSTKSYVQGKDTYTVNIGLIEKGVPTIGLIYLPALSKLYYTNELGKLAIEENGEVVASSGHLEKKDYNAVVGNRASLVAKEFLAKYPINEIKSVSSSLKLCLIADGSVDIYPKIGEATMEWDIAAGHALIKASGGNIFDSDGVQLQYGKNDFQNLDFYACSKWWLEKD